MRQNQHEKLFDEFMDITEFSLVKHPDGSWSVWDRQGANLGTINDDHFNSAAKDYFTKGVKYVKSKHGQSVL